MGAPTNLANSHPTSGRQDATGWRGKADLIYGAEAHRTWLRHSYTQAPLRLQRALYPEGEAVCHSVLVHTAGGMVGGDRLDITIELESGSQALITTAAANKIYRSQDCAAQQTVHMQLAESSCLEWFPQETICFKDSHFSQGLRVDLAPGATWVGWDITRFGRSARGEQFEAGHWRSHTEVWQQARPLWIDHQVLQGGSDVLTSPHGLAGYPVIASLVLIGQTPSAEQLAAIRQLWSSLSIAATAKPGEVGITQLQQGLLCRYRGPSSQTARRWFTAIWEALRPWYSQKSACIPRVWANSR